jgi:AcrR family transcriptional regulator
VGDAGSKGHETRKRTRKKPEARRTEIVATARTVFASNGYTGTGLAEVARAATVSKGLLYHYFPQGRPQLYRDVVGELLDELLTRLREAVKLPFSSRTRLTHLLGAVFAYFDENPAAFGMLFREPWASGDEDVQACAVAARAQLAAEVAALMADTGLAPDRLLAASTGIVGFTLANVDLCLTGQLTPETAWSVTCEHCITRLGEDDQPEDQEGIRRPAANGGT